MPATYPKADPDFFIWLVTKLYGPPARIDTSGQAQWDECPWCGSETLGDFHTLPPRADKGNWVKCHHCAWYKGEVHVIGDLCRTRSQLWDEYQASLRAKPRPAAGGAVLSPRCVRLDGDERALRYVWAGLTEEERATLAAAWRIALGRGVPVAHLLEHCHLAEEAFAEMEEAHWDTCCDPDCPFCKRLLEGVRCET